MFTFHIYVSELALINATPSTYLKTTDIMVSFYDLQANERNVRKRTFDMCAQRRFRSACSFAQYDQNLHWAHLE